MHTPLLRLFSFLLILSLLVIPAGAFAAPENATVDAAALATKVVFFASDGMRPDLMETYAAQGLMPTYAALMAAGVRGNNGMVQAFPPNTGVGWYTMMTGAYPGEHGSTNNTFFRGGDTFTNRTSFSATGVLQADTLAAAAERAGKTVAQIDWVGGAQSVVAGPTVDFANFFSTRGVLAAPLNPAEQAGAAAFGISYQVASFAPASGWSNVPPSTLPPMQTTLTVATSFAAQNPTRVYDVYVYAAGSSYDHVLLVRSAAAKDGNQASVNLAVGDFKEIKLSGADGLIGARAGQTAGFYTKLISLAGDLSSFKLYFTSVDRVIAKCATAACNALPAGGAGEDKLEKYIADNLPTYIAADFAPLEARIIDEDTYVQQGRDMEKAYADAVLSYILGTLQPGTNVAFVGYPVTDEFSHQFMALYTPTDMDGAPNPTYDDADYNGVPDGRVAIREGYVRSAYHEADAKLALARSLMGGNPTTFAGSDHGFAPQWYAVNARKVLFDATLNGTSLSASSGNTASNCGAAANDLTKACWAGGAVQIYINPAQLQSTANPTFPTYAQVQNAIISAFQNLSDPANPGKQVVLKIMRKDELRNVDGSDSLHPNRSGDVVVVLRPPYQWDAATPAVRIAYSQFFGQHGYLPELVDIAHNVNMHATFVAAGPGIRRQNPVSDVRAVDLAPTLAFLMGIPGPQNARGKILTNLVARPGQYKEITVLDISDYHGQLVPLAEASDTLGPTFGIGGSAFLKAWFDLYRSEAPNGSVAMAAGDSVGATPPISAFFGDTPTIEIMNLMGIQLDGLGNHNFDKGQTYLRNTLIPLAQYPFISSNVVDANGNTPAEWKPSVTFDIFGGAKVGFVGFTNEDAPTLVTPGAFDPFHVDSRATFVQAEVNRLRSRGITTIIVIGHDGATAGTITSPTGPLVDLADQLTGVDVIIGDHTNFQVLATRPNGVLITENLSKGARFTRVRVLVDSNSKAVVYKTADFHKPWNIGMIPDPAIQTRINDLNAQLTPILGTVIGSSTVEVLRSDACGRSDGRLCESLVGDVVTDAMRTAYTPIGVEFAITNSGGLRDRLTCPAAGGGTGFCPSFTPPPYLITRGQVLAVLPFGNIVVTLQVNGAELKSMLENGVSLMPGAQGRFPQVSGLCFTYNIEAAAGNRVTGAVRQAPDGSCTGAAVDLTTASTYKIAENDFMSTGGDGYPNFFSRATTQNIMDQVVADYITAHTPISPAIQGRVHCVDPTPGSGNDCPPGSP
jgi:2',3'-cyclic-nucleotide 2'-phosphodiesterase (5'-nucleotidase family)/predicted AlkP superfamily phosphohydrolase/phosphomutase